MDKLSPSEWAKRKGWTIGSDDAHTRNPEEEWIYQRGLTLSAEELARLRRTYTPSSSSTQTHVPVQKMKTVEGADEEDEDEKNECKICLTNKVKCIVMPCMHVAMCITCVNKLEKNDPCPLCRTPVQDRAKVFMD